MTPLESIYKEPESWTVGESYFRHKDGFAIRVDNGPNFCSPVLGGEVGFFEKRRYWKAFSWWRKTAPIEAYTNARGDV